MNIEAYNLDSLRKLVRDLQKDNKELRSILDKAGIPYALKSVFSEGITDTLAYDPDQGGRISPFYVDERLAKSFIFMFWGRDDVFARRARNGNYYPQCDNRWNDRICPKQAKQKIYCEDCEHKHWTRLSLKTIENHLRGNSEDGTDVVGIYPLLPDGTCRFLVFDFDNHEKDAEKNDFANTDEAWHDEVDALRAICRQNGIDALVERSRSGKGAHVWIFFRNPIPATTARNFGFLLLDKGTTTISLKSFRYYDRMYPSQDVANSIGNLIALPLQGQALKNGNSAFVDENWNAYPDQINHLFQTRRLELGTVEAFIDKWREEVAVRTGKTEYSKKLVRLKPWKRDNKFCDLDVTGKMHFVLADGVYIDALNLAPRLQNQIRCMATFDNPIFYKNKRLGYSNYYNSSMVYMGKDIDGYIKIPRGLMEAVIHECKKSGIEYDFEDQREKGRPIRVSFQGELRVQQDLAAQRLLSYDNGILSAATAFGKTVVCSYLIAQRKVNTLILLERTDLIDQWVDELNHFLMVDEEVPEYQTKTGRIKKRKSVIGTLKGGKDALTGIIDVAMIGSIYKKGKFHEMLNTYGMVIMDECHHAASATAQEVLKKVNARYVYGVSATPMRSDNLEKINYMLLGPIRHRYTALERAEQQGIDHLVIPRYTRAVHQSGYKCNITEAYDCIGKSEVRNDQIVDDVRICVEAGRTPIILTRYKEHARVLYQRVREMADNVFLLYGDNTGKENEEIRRRLKDVPPNQSLILVATGQKIGEGFDFPRLDTLFLAAPVSYEGRLEQYVGRLNRDYEGKKDVIVYDYIDSQIEKFEKMYLKRLRTYKKIGFHVTGQIDMIKQDANAIYDAGNYMDVFERDLIEAENNIVVCSPRITAEKVERFIFLMKPRQESGVKITVLIGDPEDLDYENTEFVYMLAEQMRAVGILVITRQNLTEHFAVIDDRLVWHGGANLLGKEDVWDNLIRVTDSKVAAELMSNVHREQI